MLIGRYLDIHQFVTHPFGETAAEKEELLWNYFVEPRYFAEALGDARRPKSYVVFGPRGGGKSAIRSMIELYCNSAQHTKDVGGPVLWITYDDFTALNLRQVGSIGLTDHVNEILKRAVPRLIVSLVDAGRVGDDLPSEFRGLLRWYIDEYMSDLSKLELDKILRSLQSQSDTLKNLLTDAVELYNSVISVLKLEQIKPSKPVDGPKSKRDSNSSVHVMEAFCRLAAEVGFKAVYVLVDKVDETDQTSSDSKKAQKLVHSLLTSIKLLELEGCAFKLFLWDKVRSHFGEELREDRITMKSTEWSDVDVQRMLERRVQAYSLMRTSLTDLFVPNLRANIARALTRLAYHSPRDVNRLMQEIIAETIPDATAESPLITEKAVLAGVNSFSMQRGKELYGEETLTRLRRLNKTTFTIADVAATFKITGGQNNQNVDDQTATNQARNVVEKWKSAGVIVQGDSVIKKVNGRNRSVNQYVIIDPRAAHLVDPRAIVTELQAKVPVA